MQEHINPMIVFLSAFSIASFAGLAALLRTGDQVTKKSVTSAMLNSGLLSLALSLMLHKSYRDNIYFLIGVCISVGLGGNPMVDFMLAWLKTKLNSGFPLKSKEFDNGKDQTNVPDKS